MRYIALVRPEFILLSLSGLAENPMNKTGHGKLEMVGCYE